MAHRQAARAREARHRPPAVVTGPPVVPALPPHAVVAQAPRLPAADAAAGDRN